jgi:hypothetical protein
MNIPFRRLSLKSGADFAEARLSPALDQLSISPRFKHCAFLQSAWLKIYDISGDEVYILDCKV